MAIYLLINTIIKKSLNNDFWNVLSELFEKFKEISFGIIEKLTSEIESMVFTQFVV